MAHTPISCEEASLLLGSHESSAAGLQEHLTTCVACSELASEQALLWQLLADDGPVPAPSADFTRRVVAAATTAPAGRVVGLPSRAWHLGATLLAASLLIAIVLAWPGAGDATLPTEVASAPQDEPLVDDESIAASVDELLDEIAALEEIPAEDRLVVAFLDVASEGTDDDWLVEQMEDESEVTDSDLLALELAADLGDF